MTEAQHFIVRAVPHPTLNPNDRSPRIAKQPWYCKLRDSAHWDVHNQGWSPMSGWVEARACICWPAKKFTIFDQDNARAALKGLWDGIGLNRGIWEDDRFLVVAEVHQHVMEKEARAFYPEGCIVVSLREIPEPEPIPAPIDAAGMLTQSWLSGFE